MFAAYHQKTHQKFFSYWYKFYYSFSELPESMCLKFQCGVQIQLGFAAEFSNVMIIYTSIVHKPPDILMCDAYVTDFPLVSLYFFLLFKL